MLGIEWRFQFIRLVMSMIYRNVTVPGFARGLAPPRGARPFEVRRSSATLAVQTAAFSHAVTSPQTPSARETAPCAEMI
jgi:hypothetical protein